MAYVHTHDQVTHIRVQLQSAQTHSRSWGIFSAVTRVSVELAEAPRKSFASESVCLLLHFVSLIANGTEFPCRVNQISHMRRTRYTEKMLVVAA